MRLVDQKPQKLDPQKFPAIQILPIDNYYTHIHNVMTMLLYRPREAVDMLVHNSQNLVSMMEEVLSATEIATIKLSPSAMEDLNLEWIKRTN